MPKNHLQAILAVVLSLAITSTSFAASAPTYDALIQQAIAARNAGNFEAAEANLVLARDLANETSEVDFLLGMVQAFQERFIDAMATLDAALERYPDDVSLRLARARVLSYQGIYEQAIDATDDVLASNPGLLEALNLRARIYFYQNRHSAAVSDYEEVLAAESDNLEAIIGLYDAELARNNDDAAGLWLERAQDINPNHIDVITRQERLAPQTSRHHMVTIGGARSRFNRAGFERWTDRFIEYRYLRDSGDQFHIYAEHDRRFSLRDSLFEVGYRFGRQGSPPLELAVGWNADSQFLPSRQYRLGTSLMLLNAGERIGATTLGINLTHARYETGDVSRLGLDFTHYLLGINAWITPSLGLVRDENGDQDLSWALGAHWQTGPRSRVGYTFTNAPETENSITVLTRAHHAYVSYQLTDTLNLRLDGATNDRHDAYRRDNISLSLQFRF